MGSAVFDLGEMPGRDRSGCCDFPQGKAAFCAAFTESLPYCDRQCRPMLVVAFVGHSYNSAGLDKMRHSGPSGEMAARECSSWAP